MKRFPSTADAVKSRGAWLGFAYAMTARKDVQMLLGSLKVPEPPTSVFNTIRIEIAVYLLSKWSKKIEPVLMKQFSDSSPDEVMTIKWHLLDGAWTALGFLFAPGERDDFSQTYEKYASDVDASTLFWKRLSKDGISFDIASCQAELDRFERTILDRTMLFNMLDSVTISQEDVEQAHRTMAEKLDLNHNGSGLKLFVDLGILPKR